MGINKMGTKKHDWLDKYIKEQSSQRKVIKKITGKSNAAKLQQRAEHEGWD